MCCWGECAGRQACACIFPRLSRNKLHTHRERESGRRFKFISVRLDIRAYPRRLLIWLQQIWSASLLWNTAEYWPCPKPWFKNNGFPFTWHTFCTPPLPLRTADKHADTGRIYHASCWGRNATVFWWWRQWPRTAKGMRFQAFCSCVRRTTRILGVLSSCCKASGQTTGFRDDASSMWVYVYDFVDEREWALGVFSQL